MSKDKGVVIRQQYKALQRDDGLYDFYGPYSEHVDIGGEKPNRLMLVEDPRTIELLTDALREKGWVK